MELTPYVDRLRRDLADAAAAGGAEAQQAAERLALALDPATRMMLLEALSQAAAEITGSLDHDAVDVRLNGREPEFVVSHLEAAEAHQPPPPPDPPTQAEPEDASQSRITLRLPESVKVRAEESAAEVGQSLNAWLVDAVRDALDGRGRVDLQLGSSRITVSGNEGGRRRQIRGWVS
jgi:HicB family